jgi:hypothetical protein
MSRDRFSPRGRRGSNIRNQLRRRALLREVNERIRDLNARFGAHTGTYVLLCECVSGDCVRRVEVSASVYEELRTEQDRFVVAPGHERPEHERVIAKEEHHLVVATSASSRARVLEPQIDAA